MESQLQLPLLLFFILLVCPSDMAQATRVLESVNQTAGHCNLNDFAWNITKPVEKEWVEWVDIGVRNRCIYCDAKDVNLALLTADHTRDNVALKKPIPAGKSQIFRYQTRVSVVDEVQIVRADFVNCRP